MHSENDHYIKLRVTLGNGNQEIQILKILGDIKSLEHKQAHNLKLSRKWRVAFTHF